MHHWKFCLANIGILMLLGLFGSVVIIEGQEGRKAGMQNGEDRNERKERKERKSKVSKESKESKGSEEVSKEGRK